MKIKEAARICGLTEKAIRLYEAKGLITPDIHIYEQNGRAFRDYDEKTVERLKTIAGLRRAFFSLEQISRMLDTPDAVEGVWRDYLAELKEQYAQLDLLIRRADAVPEIALVSAEALSAALEMRDVPDEPEEEAPEKTEPSLSTAAPDFHFSVWDEEEERDVRERLREKYFGPHAKWGIWYDVTLTVRKIWEKLWKPLLAGSVLLFLLWFFPYIETVDVSYPGYELLFDTVVTDEAGVPVITEAVPRTVTFSGKIYHYLLRNTMFRGNVEIEGYSYLKCPPAAGIRGLPEVTEPEEKEKRRIVVLKKNRAGQLLNIDPPKMISGYNGYQTAFGASASECVFLFRDDRQVWADALCVYRSGTTAPGAFLLLRERPTDLGYRSGYSGVIVYGAETEEEAKAMFSDTVWKHWREEYGYQTAWFPFNIKTVVQ